MNVIFMGTPLFAVPTLKAIYDSESHKVVAVFSQKPKAKGRGMKITESPIHEIANNTSRKVQFLEQPDEITPIQSASHLNEADFVTKSATKT